MVVSTLGRLDALDNLLRDLADQTERPHAVAVCDQGTPGADGARDVESVCAAHRGTLDIHVVRSARGLSRGRNAAAAVVAAEVDYLFFPNDTSRVASDFLARVDAAGEPHVIAAQYRDTLGPRTSFNAATVPIDPANAWLAMEPAMLVRSDEFQSLGGFDVDLGSGAATPWQSGEGTELLLRLARDGARVRFAPDLVVTGVVESEGLSGAERRRKLRAYGRGYGHILRVWNYGARRRLAAVIGGFTLGLRHPSRFSLRDGWHVGLGRAEGAMNRLLGRSLTAVDR